MPRPEQVIRIGSVLLYHNPHFALTVTIWPDSCLFLPAVPEDTDEYRQRARGLGYGEDTAGMSFEHEAAHHLMAVRLDSLPYSPTLHAAARGEEYAGAGAEETRVMGFQMMLNAPAEGVPLSWDELVREARGLLRGDV